MEFILADVRRIIPARTDTKEYFAYAEYMDFYDVTKNPYIVFSHVGDYRRLAENVGADLEHEWSETLLADLKTAFFNFCKRCRAELKMTDIRALSEAFLGYISIFPLKTIFRDSEEQIIKNIRMASAELTSGSKLINTQFFDSVPEANEQKSLISRLLTMLRGYTASSPLKVGFVYDAGIEESRWIDSHEAGRLYVDEMTADNVVTAAYCGNRENVREMIDKAVKDGCGIIFTVSPSMMSEAVKAAVQYPNVKILNCSFGNPAATVRCYYGSCTKRRSLWAFLRRTSCLPNMAANAG